MRKILVLILGLVMLFTGCTQVDDKPITSEWQYIQMTVDGETTSYSDLSDFEKGAAPRFECEDGENFVFTNYGLTHHGYLTYSNETYTLHYNDTDKVMEAQIHGNVMEITIPGSDIMILFETDR